MLLSAREKNPNPHVSTINIIIMSGATAPIDKTPRFRPNAAATEIKDRHKRIVLPTKVPHN